MQVRVLPGSFHKRGKPPCPASRPQMLRETSRPSDRRRNPNAQDSALKKLAKPKVQMCARQRLTNAGRTSGLKAFNVRAPCRPKLSPNQTLRKQPCTCVQRHVCWKHDVVSEPGTPTHHCGYRENMRSARKAPKSTETRTPASRTTICAKRVRTKRA